MSDISDAGQIVTQLHCRIYPTWGREGVKNQFQFIFLIRFEIRVAVDRQVSNLHRTISELVSPVDPISCGCFSRGTT